MVLPLSRSGKITLLLVIDILFFLLELTVGYVTDSLALISDSFHMLNDVMSLVVALYAMKLAGKAADQSRYSYGWQRVEILAALINGVFLLSLCFSVALQAIDRFSSISDVSNPLLIVIVGSCGLASNIFGFFLFHEHGPHNHGHPHAPSHTDKAQQPPAPQSVLERTDSYTSMYGHPVATRAAVAQAALEMTSSQHDALQVEEVPRTVFDAIPLKEVPRPVQHTDAMPRARSQGHGHNPGSMNMRAILLHVIGDALGNIGVIISALVIWLTSWSGRFYLDPAISLMITVIIFTSALPLVRSASIILLQGVPQTVSLGDVRDSILKVDGVLSLHELHVWQLSESKIVASVHVMTSRDHDFMPVATDIRRELHLCGIHSSTIQPEYYPRPSVSPEDQLQRAGESQCLIPCPKDQICDPAENACCPPPPSV